MAMVRRSSAGVGMFGSVSGDTTLTVISGDATFSRHWSSHSWYRRCASAVPYFSQIGALAINFDVGSSAGHVPAEGRLAGGEIDRSALRDDRARIEMDSKNVDLMGRFSPTLTPRKIGRFKNLNWTIDGTPWAIHQTYEFMENGRLSDRNR